MQTWRGEPFTFCIWGGKGPAFRDPTFPSLESSTETHQWNTTYPIFYRSTVDSSVPLVSVRVSVTVMFRTVSCLYLGFSGFTVFFRWIKFFIMHMPLFTVDMHSFCCGTAKDMESVYHVTRIKWLYFANKSFKQKIAYLPQKVAYYL